MYPRMLPVVSMAKPSWWPASARRRIGCTWLKEEALVVTNSKASVAKRFIRTIGVGVGGEKERQKLDVMAVEIGILMMAISFDRLVLY